MRYVEIELSKIEGNPKNYRKTYQGIEKLANSIATYGLLQNLVVIEYQPGKYHVHAGERRYRAIRLLAQQTDASNRPRWEGPVRCVIITTFGLEDVVENEERAHVAIWQTGARYAEEYDKGVDQTTIAAKVGKTQSHVSQALRISAGLAPKVKKMLDKIGPDALTLAQLFQLIKHKDSSSGEPDEERQVQQCIEFLGKDRTKRSPRDGEKARRDRIIDRVYRLDKKVVPLHARAIFENIVEYLHGRRTRLKF